MNIKPKLLPVLLACLFIFACGGGGNNNDAGTNNGSNNGDGDSNADGGDEPSTPQFQRGQLISSSLITSKQRLPYKVDAYRIVYVTIDTNNNTIKVSGLLTIPKKGASQKSPLISYQHGTNFLDKDVPSNSASSISAIMTLSGNGYIVSSPDYIGYGESVNKMHPYLHAESLANASIDLLRASKKFLSNKNILINSQLFLAGYSEGGYATLALQKSLEENHTNEFTVTASAAGAGPFDLTETAKYLANKLTNDNPSYMSFLLKAYDTVYGLNKITEMYQPQYVNAVNNFYHNNKHSGKEIDENLSHITNDLFKPLFLSALQGSAQHIINDKLAENNIYDWAPQAPTRLYHSPKDEIVPYSNATKALDTMQSRGATNVTLRNCNVGSGSHVTCAFPYVLNTLSYFSGYVSDL